MLFHQIIGMFFIFTGIFFIVFGIYGLYRYKDFFARASLTALIDSAGFLCVALGGIIYKGFSTFSFKTLLLLLLMLLLNPLANHYIVRSAHLSGYTSRKER